MSFFSSKRRVAIAAVLLLLLFLLRPGASRLKARIAGSLSAALARPVEIGSVHVRLLPRPGFDLENLVVYDDPAFGQEAMLRAPEVTADLRLISLVRGRLEVSRLDLSDPSLNLVHGANGRWNLEALLERTSQVPLAPTAKARSEARPAFPYIQVSSGRINFKNGQVKKPYALTNADFALWQDSENTWGVRLKAEPFRGDMNLNDTGTLRVNGTWQRAASLRDTPLQFNVAWDRPQLGQLTKFLSGEDKGWRGGLQLDMTLAGTPANLKVASDASVRDFRRYDISGPASFVAAHCDGRYSSIDHLVHEVLCRLPVGAGQLTLKGEVGLPASHRYNLLLNAEDVPAGALVALALRTRKNLPENLQATGEVRGILAMEKKDPAEAPKFTGTGEIVGLHLTSPGSKGELEAASIPLRLTTGEAKDGGPAGPRLQFGPVSLASTSGRSASPVAKGWVAISGYGVALTGEGEVGRTLRMASLVGLPALAATAEGLAQMDLQIAGTWHEWVQETKEETQKETQAGLSTFAQPQVTGTVKLKSVRAEVRGVDGPIEISSASLQLLPDKVRVTKLSVNAAHALWAGSMELPRGCGTPGACTVRFDLTTNQFGLSDAAQWASPRPKPRPWYRLSAGTDPAGLAFFSRLHAQGKVTVGHLLLHGVNTGVNAGPTTGVTANRVSAIVTVDSGKLTISDLHGDLFGGKHSGNWTLDFSVKPPVYRGSGSVSGIALRQVASAMHDEWIAGTGSGNYQITASGASSEFWKSVEGTLQFDMSEGMLPHVMMPPDDEAMRLDRLQGRAHLHDGKIEIEDGTLDSSDGKFQISGSASFGRELDLTLVGKSETAGSGSSSSNSSSSSGLKTYALGGTLAEPRVTLVANPETQAQLKSQ